MSTARIPGFAIYEENTLGLGEQRGDYLSLKEMVWALITVLRSDMSRSPSLRELVVTYSDGRLVAR
jgi:hypothetical protein